MSRVVAVGLVLSCFRCLFILLFPHGHGVVGAGLGQAYPSVSPRCQSNVCALDFKSSEMKRLFLLCVLFHVFALFMLFDLMAGSDCLPHA